MEYSKLVRLAPWQKKSAKIKDRDGWQCRRCSDSLSQLQVHHLYYVHDGRMPWEYEDDCFITLCDLCHMKAEFYKWLVRNVWALRDQGFEVPDLQSINTLVQERLEQNMHRESAIRYMSDIKNLING